MAMARICDKCGELVKAPHKQLKILSVETEDTAPRDYKTVKSLDLHNECLEDIFNNKIDLRRLTLPSKKMEGVPANGGKG